LGGESKEGIPDVEIRAKLIVDAAEGDEEIYKTTKTQPDGTYVIDNLPPGNFEILVIPTAYEERSTAVVLDPIGIHDIANIDFDYDNKAKFNVVVTSEDFGGMPIPMIFVKLRSLDSSLSVGKEISRSEETDANGMVMFDNLPSGTYEIFIEETPVNPSSGNFENIKFVTTSITKTVFALTPTNTVDLEFDLEPLTFSMAGTIKEKKGLTKIAKREIIESITFEGDQFPEGDNLRLHTGDIHIHFDPTAFIQGGTIEGELSESHCFSEEFPSCLEKFGPSGADAYNLENLPGATVKIIELEFLGQPVDPAIIATLQDSITDSSGNYLLDNLLPGFIGIEVSKDGYLPKQFFFTFPPSNDLMGPDPTFCYFS